jgi:hypothetical protein
MYNGLCERFSLDRRAAICKDSMKKHSRPTYAFFAYFRPRDTFREVLSAWLSERKNFCPRPTYAFFSRQKMPLVALRPPSKHKISLPVICGLYTKNKMFIGRISGLKACIYIICRLLVPFPALCHFLVHSFWYVIAPIISPSSPKV